MSKKKHFDYDVALSFAGEDRTQAEALAHLLRRSDVQVFYDDFHKASLWGKDLFQHLEKIYKDMAQYCVVFVSKHYVKKNWTKHELKQAQARSFESDREYVLPLRLDDTVLPGVAATVGYIDLRKTKMEQVAVLLLEKLGKSPSAAMLQDVERAVWSGEVVEYNGMRVAGFWPKILEAAQHKPVYLVTRPYERIRHGSESYWKKKKVSATCHDCAALPGQYHAPQCDMEECPACGGQMIGCGCKAEAIDNFQLEKWENDEDYSE